MRYEILHRPSFSMAHIELESGEAIKAETGAMVSMSSNIELQTETGGLLGAFKRSIGGESLFLNTFRAQGKGDVQLAPAYPGDVEVLETTETIYAQSGAFMAGPEDVEIDTKLGGFKTFFAREGLFLLKIRSSGPVFLSSFGAIYSRELVNERFIVDTGHIVAFTEGLDFSVRKVGGLKSTFLSGEGLVAEFEGTGTVYMQSRSIDSFVGWLTPMLPSRS
ncbi:TIGR00266 family protein [Methanothermobacter thermautotrophicus]|uniref:TIGR00266 family protein n=1 Tax=Methanothermobacter thermautotrophicus TaxID=145262 RepID=A0A842YNU4_METTF|nr:TIGR00266 family protein [Methanothermobacter thermautotrophicus]MBE2899633.1 TIGR00266 family protein [Methanothermobacter thermautotrophicus]MCQ8905121.1 TIGR00266 family protein [Methanothermobacter sp.]